MAQPLLETYGSTDIGNVRANNEDAWASLPGYPFFALADGMGGHKAGEIAAKEAVENLCQSILRHLHPQKKTPVAIEELSKQIENGFLNANDRIYRLSKEYNGFKGMGTTLCCYYFHQKTIIYAHVGDSRIYKIRNNEIQQLTEDHSLATTDGKKRNLGSQYNHVITRAVGMSADVSPEIGQLDVEEGDIFFMCSDGLSDFLPLEEMLETILDVTSIKCAVSRLIQKAKKRGSTDNITLVMTKVEALYD